MSEKFVECGSHGKAKPAFICIHLTIEKGIGWNESEVPEKPDDSEFYDCIKAWCDDCENVGRLTTGFIENSFANIQLVCEECALKFKEASSK